MLRSLCLLAAIALLFLAEVSASSRPSNAELAAITERGVFLAEYDTAAWRASDAVKAAHPVEARVGRYIARKTEGGWVVDFGRLNEAGDKFLVAYEVVQRHNSESIDVKAFDPARQDGGWNLAAAKGIETAMKDFGGTTRPYNIAVLPAEREGMYVYLYPAQVKTGVYPLGGDVRYHVSLDGTKIIEKRQMHKTIIESAPSTKDVKVAVGYHSHVLSDLPEDTDVLLVLSRKGAGPPLLVSCAPTNEAAPALRVLQSWAPRTGGPTSGPSSRAARFSTDLLNTSVTFDLVPNAR